MIRVLAPINGTPESFDALEKGLQLLSGRDVTVTLLVVMQEGFESAPEDVTQAFDDDEDDSIFPTLKSAQRVLEAASKRCTQATVEHLCLEGKPRDVILEQAASSDMLLMGALQKSNLKDRLRMSSAEYIVRRSPCTVLLVQ